MSNENRKENISKKQEEPAVGEQDVVQELEVKAATEDMEFKKYEELYIDARKTLDEFNNLIKIHNLENGKENSIKYLEGMRDELKQLLDDKNYVKFTEVKNIFDSILKGLGAKVKEELKEEKKAAPEPAKPKRGAKDSSVESVAAGEIENTETVVTTEPAKPSAEVVKPTPKAPEVAKPMVAKPAEKVSVAPAAPAPAGNKTPKKGLWSRFKEGVGQVFNRETGKVAGKVSYDTVTSVLGIKFVTDVVYALKGKGDLVEWWKGRREAKEVKDKVAKAYEDLMDSLKRDKQNKALAEFENVENRIASFKAKVESAHIAPEAKKALQVRVLEIATQYKEKTDEAIKERSKEVRRILDAYLEAKVSGMKIARDALNFALTASGFSMLRGMAYAGASIAERARKARKSYTQEETGKEKPKSEAGFVAKDFAKAAIETARALIGKGDKKGASGKTKVIDFIKALDTVARGFGIYGLAAAGTTVHEVAIDKLLSEIKERGVAITVSDNFINHINHVVQNAEHAGHLVAHPAEIITGNKDLAPQPAHGHEVSLPIHEHHPLAETHPAPIPEVVEHGNHTVAVVELNNREGILNGVNKIIHNNPNVFVHENGKAWSADEIHTWKARELKDMGFKIEGYKWGYPMTVHGGAKVEVFTDEQGRPHFKLASEEHVTWHRNYKWEESKPADHAVAEHANKADKFINPYPDNKADHLINPYQENAEHPTVAGYHRGVQMPENSTAAEIQQFRDLKRQYAAGTIDRHEFAKEATRLTRYEVVERAGQNGDHYFEQSTAPVAEHPTVAEHPVAHKEVRVDSDIKEKAVVHHAENEKSVQENIVPAKSAAIIPEKVSPVPEAAPAHETVGQFLKEHNSNPKDFVATYDKMVDRTIDRLQDSFILRVDAHEFLKSKLDALQSKTGITEKSLSSSTPIDAGSSGMITKMLEAENKFKLNQDGWAKIFNETMFSDSDKSMSLALASGRDVSLHPILTNGGHGARIWNPAEQKDIFIYDKDSIFNTNKAGRLVVEYKDGTKELFTQKQIIKMSS